MYKLKNKKVKIDLLWNIALFVVIALMFQSHILILVKR